MLYSSHSGVVQNMHAPLQPLPFAKGSSKPYNFIVRAREKGSEVTKFLKELKKQNDQSEENVEYPPIKSRGELYLETMFEKSRSVQQRREFEQFQQQKKAEARRRRKERAKALADIITGPRCYGCGAILHSSAEDTPGYIPLDLFTLKKKHHQLNTVLCIRCRSLSHGQILPAVGGYGGVGRKKGFVSAEELRAQLSHLRYEKVLVVKLVDIIDFSGSFLSRVRDLVGANPIILIVTKVDLLPEGTDMAAVGDWILESTLKKKLSVISIHLTSAKASTGISAAAAEIVRQRQGRDVYILGSANVGKSAFISVLLQEMASRDPAAGAAKRYKPVQSMMPGTTLGPIALNAFSHGGTLYDTPGIHLHHRIETAVYPEDLALLSFSRRLRGYVVSAMKPERGELPLLLAQAVEESEENGRDENDDIRDLSGSSLFWGGIIRIDVLQAPSNVKFVFYGPPALKVHRVMTRDADMFYKNELGKVLIPPSGAERIPGWMGLQQEHPVTVPFGNNRAMADIAISGLGWVAVEFVNSAPVSDPKDVAIIIHTPKSVEVFPRPPMPVGSSTWYTYADLTDDELIARPRLHYGQR